jgi:hypothetical protein
VLPTTEEGKAPDVFEVEEEATAEAEAILVEASDAAEERTDWVLVLSRIEKVGCSVSWRFLRDDCKRKARRQVRGGPTGQRNRCWQAR